MEKGHWRLFGAQGNALRELTQFNMGKLNPVSWFNLAKFSQPMGAFCADFVCKVETAAGDREWKSRAMGVSGDARVSLAIHAHTTALTMAAMTTSSVTAVRAVQGARATFGSRAAFAAPTAKASKARFVCRAEGEVR